MSGFEYIVSYAYTLKDDDPAKYVFKQAVQDGKTGISIEAGKLGNVQPEAVKLIKIGVYNMLNKMGMYAKATEAKGALIRLNNQAYIRSPEQGIFYSDHKAGDSVKESNLPLPRGGNTFVWDMRYPGFTAFDGMILWWGNLSGPQALPGQYLTRLIIRRPIGTHRLTLGKVHHFVGVTGHQDSLGFA